MSELLAALERAWAWLKSDLPLPRGIRLLAVVAGVVAVILAVVPPYPAPPLDDAETLPTRPDVRLIAADPAPFGFFRAIRLNAINVGGRSILFERDATLHVDGQSYEVRLFAQGDGPQDQILSPQETALIGLADSEAATRVLPELTQFDCKLEYHLRSPLDDGEEETHVFSFPCRTLPRPD